MNKEVKKLLIVVDFQIDFVSGTLGFNKAKELDEKIYRKINEYKSNSDLVIYTFDTHDENYLSTIEGKYLPIKHCIDGSDGHHLYGKVATTFDEKRDIYFKKETFPSLDLENYLKGKEFTSVELCGLVSNICVLSNAVMVKSALPNTEIFINKELTSSFDEKLNQECFDILKGLHINVIESNNEKNC